MWYRTPRTAAISVIGTVLAWAVWGATAGGEPRSAVRLTVYGCGAGVPIVQHLAEAFLATRPQATFDFKVVGSTAGIALAAAGAVDIGVTSRDLRPEEEDIVLLLVPFSRTAVVLAAHPSVPVAGITTTELLDLFRGTISHWAGGARVTVVTREWGESAIQELRRTLPGFEDAYTDGLETSQTRLVYSEAALHQALRSTPYAVGLSTAGALSLDSDTLKTLRLDGILPMPENVVTRHYPLTQTLALVLRDDLASPLAREFVAFARSAAAQPILERYGYVPIQ